MGNKPSRSCVPAEVGKHLDVTCEECGFSFACGAAENQAIGDAVCPNCQRLGCDPQSRQKVVSGDRLMVFKGAYLFNNPNRWDVAVFRHPRLSSQAYVKRIVGLPGETVQLRNGDLYINGHLVRKTLPQQHAVAVLVYDADFPSPQLPPRWKAASAPQTDWKQIGTQFLLVPSIPQQGMEGPGAFDWLIYQHGWRLLGTTRQADEAPIADSLAYNTQTRRVEDVSTVTDVMLTCTLRVAGPGRLALHASDGRDHFDVQLQPSNRQAVLLHNGREVLRATAGADFLQQSTEVVLSIIDRQLLFSLNGQQVFPAYPFGEIFSLPPAPDTRPLAIGAEGLSVEVEHLKVYRDIYYTQPGRSFEAMRSHVNYWGVTQPHQLGRDEFFGLGDNSAASEDSRLWTCGPAVHRRSLIGRPMFVHLPYRATNNQWRIQVPDFAKIRYIR